MPRTLEMSTVQYLSEELQRAVADPTYAKQNLVIDLIDRENCSIHVGHEFTEDEWLDFVDFCSHETTPWQDWFEQWRNSGRHV